SSNSWKATTTCRCSSRPTRARRTAEASGPNGSIRSRLVRDHSARCSRSGHRPMPPSGPLTEADLADLFEGRTRLVEELAKRDDPLGDAPEVIAQLSDEDKLEALNAHP